ncbi:hypothetical protein BD779DRAFT_626665 [Infundibulicybe gibba]|nr:hypothetical protein BD779DRAFT_626665 [Infundibulicybe gibba]
MCRQVIREFCALDMPILLVPGDYPQPAGRGTPSPVLRRAECWRQPWEYCSRIALAGGPRAAQEVGCANYYPLFSWLAYSSVTVHTWESQLS